MAGLSEELGALRAQRLDSTADARPGPDVHRAIARRRRRRAAGWGAAAAGVVALVAAAALPPVLDALPVAASPTPSPVLSVTGRVVEEATVTFASVEADLFGRAAGGLAACGQPLPEPVTSGDDFTASFEIPDSVSLDQGVVGPDGSAAAEAEIVYEGETELPAIVEPMIGLLARDGVVVGLTPGVDGDGLTTFSAGRQAHVEWEEWGFALACPEDPGNPNEGWESVEPGEYEIAWAAAVHASEGANAREDLRTEGFAVPGPSMLTAYREGSYECGEVLEYTSEVPITCDPHTLHGVEVDLDAGEVTFPYRAAAYVRDVDATFISEAVPATVPEPDDAVEEMLAQWPLQDPSQSLQCGDEFRGLEGADVGLEWGGLWYTLRPDTTITLRAWPRWDGWTSMEVTTPGAARLWITTTEDQALDLDNPSGRSFNLNTAAGWADLTLPEQIAIDRYVGPTAIPVEIGDIEWCGEERLTDGLLQAYLVAPFTVVDDAQARDVGSLSVWAY